MFRKLKLHIVAALLFVSLTGGVVAATVPTEQTSAACGSFLSFPAWYSGLTSDDCSTMTSVNDYEGGLSQYIWQIVLNVVEIMLQIVAYLAVFYIIYGGFQLIISSGSAEKMAKAQKTVLNASVGLVIAISAVAVKNLVWNIVTGNPNEYGIPQQGNVGQILFDVLNIVYMLAAATAVIVGVIAGLTYVTSSGDATKVANAKNTLLYALIGLAIVIFAFTITSFISGSISTT